MENNSSDEIVLIVDINNKPVGQSTRKNMRELNLIHRASYIFIKNSDNLLYVQKRVQTKDVYPGYFDPSTGGVVNISDTNDKEAAIRELNEELGISGVDIQFIDNFYYASQNVNV